MDKRDYLYNHISKVVPSDFKICPICGYAGKFEDWGVEKTRPNCKCPDCGSLERSRLYWTYLVSKSIPERWPRIVHIMPEQAIRYRLLREKLVNYNVGALSDIDSLLSEKNSLDCIIANNVVDRVDDDIALLKKMYNALTSNSIALISVNFVDDSKTDLKSVPRKYSTDYLNMVKNIGFCAKRIDASDVLDPALCYIFGIGLTDYLIAAYKD